MVGLGRAPLIALTIGISFCVRLVFYLMYLMRISHKNSVEIPGRFYRKQLQGRRDPVAQASACVLSIGRHSNHTS